MDSKTHAILAASLAMGFSDSMEHGTAEHVMSVPHQMLGDDQNRKYVREHPEHSSRKGSWKKCVEHRKKHVQSRKRKRAARKKNRKKK